LSLMTDLWLSFELDDERANLITHTFKRSTKHSEQVSRIALAALLFKLVDHLGKKKDKSAPQLYRLLVFSICTEPFNYTVREFYWINFIELMGQ